MKPPVRVLEDTEWKRFNPSLDRVRRVLSNLNEPHLTYEHMVVGGTNGKGSVSYSLAQHLPGKVGLFTSPHLIDVRERIQVDRKCVSDQFWKRAFDEISQYARDDELSYFEWIFLMAVLIFNYQKVDWGVFEVGLGGRWDAVNTLSPCLSILTNVGLDHQEILGNSIQKIAMEKIEICREKKPFFLPESISRIPEVNQKIKEMNPNRILFQLSDPPCFSDNEYLVKKVLSHLQISQKQLKCTTPPGRRQFVHTGKGVILDGAHNVMAWSDLVNWIIERNLNPISVKGAISESRNPLEFMNLMSKISDDIQVIRCGFDRELNMDAWPAGTKFIDLVQFEDSLNKPVLVTGSIYLIGSVMKTLGIKVCSD